MIAAPNGLTNLNPRILALEAAAGGVVPYLDLRSYGVIPNDTTKAAVNQTAIKTGLQAVTVPWTVVKFPAGNVYVDKSSGLGVAHSFSIRLDSTYTVPMVLDLRGTNLCQYGAGNGGQWTLLDIADGFNAGVIILGGYLQCSRIDNPDPSQFQHYLLHFYGLSTSSGPVANVDVIGTRFGQSKRAAIRFLGEPGKEITKVRILDIDIDISKSCDGSSIVPTGGGIEFQRGFDDIEIGHFSVRGHHLTGIDMEPTSPGGAVMGRVNIHDGVVDGTGATAVQVVSLGGGVTAQQVERSIFRNVKVIGGNIGILTTHNWLIDRAEVVLNTTPAADVFSPGTFGSSPLIYCHDFNTDLELRDCTLIRTADTGVPTGPLIQINPGSGGGPARIRINGGYFEQWTGSNLIEADTVPELAITGSPMFRVQNATPSAMSIVHLQATTASIAGFAWDSGRVVSPNGKMLSLASLSVAGGLATSAPGLQIDDVNITGVIADGAVTNGLLMDLSAAAFAAGSRMPPAPVVQALGVDGCTNAWVATNSAAGTVFPVISGNRGGQSGIRVGTVDPGGNVSAPIGWLYVNQSTGTLWLKTSGSGSSGWTQITVP